MTHAAAGLWLVGGALVAGCMGSPTVATPGAVQPVVCASRHLDGPAAIDAFSVAATRTGGVIVWATGGPVMREPLTLDAAPVLQPAVAWDGAFDAAVAAAIGDQIVVGAVASDGTMLIGAPLGYGSYRDLAILGGRVGNPPIATAGGETFTAAVWAGGLRVNDVDAKLQVHTSQLGVASPRASELAATTAGSEAVIAWPTADSCYFERLLDPAHGASWVDAGTCRSPRLASSGRDADVALVFERPDGAYLARATAIDLHASAATLIAKGARAPRVAEFGGTVWLSYLDATGAAVAAMFDAAGELRTTTIAHSARSTELAVIGGQLRLFVVDDGGTTAATLCAE